MYGPVHFGNQPVGTVSYLLKPHLYSKVNGRGRKFKAPGKKSSLKGEGLGMLAAGIGIPLILKLLTGKGKHKKNLSRVHHGNLRGRGILSNLLKMIGLGRRRGGDGVRTFRASGRYRI